MSSKITRKFKRFWTRKGKPAVLVVGVAAIGALSIYAVQQSKMNTPLDPAAFRPLLELIARAESNGNYNAYFGNSANTTVDFTSMSIAEVLRWQEEYIRSGSPSSAVGRYQMLNTTLSGLVQRLDIDPNKKFDQAMQDRLAVALLEKRGAAAYVNEQLSREEFAANLAKEWAALPKVTGDNPQQSYYADDGLNKSRVEVDEILAVIDKVDVK